MSKSFSAMERTNYLKKMSQKKLDVLIIGGGVTGAGIALDATSRGLSTGLVEMQDFAAGTSSRSTKLVHGGLRYLKQLEVNLVREVGKERAIVYENAPHVTTPEWMLLPIRKGGTFGKLSTSLGLRAYDFLAGVKKSERRKMLDREETLKREPLLRKEGLKGGGLYVEYRTDDARLTIEILKEAVSRGALAVNYAKAERLMYDGKKVVGVVVRDIIKDKTYSIFAKKVVNAAGPWVDTFREQDRSKEGKRLYLTKGVHLVVDQTKFPLKQAVYFDTEKDGRMVFAIPRNGKTYVGTTDTFYDDDLVNPRMTQEDLDYVLSATNYMFPNVQLGETDVESSWAGLRALIYEKGKKASEISRKDEVFVSESGLISIAGGKLTGYRKMGEKIVDLLCKELGLNAKCVTEHLRLSGGDVGGSKSYNSFKNAKLQRAQELYIDENEAIKLIDLYGSNVDCVFELIEKYGDVTMRSGLPKEIYGSLVYGIEKEMVVTPLDFFHRRTSTLIFDITWVEKWKELVSGFMGDYFQWTVNEEKKHLQDLKREIDFAKKTMERVRNTRP
ncbi:MULTISPECIES: glycerol-3-phosphate dehydrogenase/oxidase [Bacillaceae]|uniref:Glycerol-3-phosphate dehydrogenase n=1 Tax=Evansella alkalicola TaxID=745819 RepID=A0ABS6JQU8_9BACI|nr:MULTISPECIES: glycerol-3-phosphate dehydrogenase/oxidase [Bacillaceae]MBU9720924.1 glycerol-3-phosphate dehydrogenase/oxidase [Bacillus alkalicola]